MTKTMTPSTISDGQIEKAVADFRESLRKRRREFSRDAAQWVLGMKNPTYDAAQAFLGRIRAVNGLAARSVKVNFDQTPQELLDATGREQVARWNYNRFEGRPDQKLVEAMPRGTATDVELFFFHVRRGESDEVEQEYRWRGLKAVDPYTLLQFDLAEPDFLDQMEKIHGHEAGHAFGTQWRDVDGEWCTLKLYDARTGTYQKLKLGRFCDENANCAFENCWAAGVRA